MDHCNKVNTQVVDELILPADSLKNLIDSRIKKYSHKCKGGRDGRDGNDGENGAAAVFSVVGDISVSEPAENGNGVVMRNKRVKRKNRSAPRIRANLGNQVDTYPVVNYDYTNNGFNNGIWTVGKTSDYLVEVTANYSISAEEVGLFPDNDTENPVASIYLNVNGSTPNGALADVGHVLIPGDETFNSPVLNGTLTFALGLSLNQGDSLNLNVDTYFSDYYDIVEGQEVTIEFETINWTVTELSPPENNNILMSRLNKLRL